MYKSFTIKDSLHHENYRWGKSLLEYDIKINDEDKKFLHLRDDFNNDVEFQFTKTGVCFLSDLKPNETKNFHLACEADEKKCRNIDFANVVLKGSSVLIAFKDRLFTMSLDSDFDNVSVSVTEIEKGAIYSRYIVEFFISNECMYKITLKFIKDMDFFEMDEEISGNAEMNMILTLCDFKASYRHSRHRDIERADQYLTDDGLVPVIIAPYENAVPWFSSNFIEFSSDNSSCGIFIYDNNKWDNKKYPIWESDNDFGIKTKVSNDLKMYFPIKKGTRCLAVAIYDKDIKENYIEELYKQYALIPLNVVKDWILDWDENKNQYPLYFKNIDDTKMHLDSKIGAIKDTKLSDYIDNESKTVKNVFGVNPVDEREFFDWAVLFDMQSKNCSDEEFARNKAFFAFFAYLSMSENYMPTRKMLAGHPNFLIDAVSVTGLAAALFPNHPDCKVWREYFYKCVNLNMKYHIRPDVIEWGTKGGRATESYGIYNFASLTPMMKVLTLHQKAGYDIELDYINGGKWLNCMTNSLSAPVEGRRVFLPQGAHSGRFHNGFNEIPCYYLALARLVADKCPQFSKTAVDMCQNSQLVVSEDNDYKYNPWREIIDLACDCKIPDIQSEAFTGYGYILRADVGRDSEISVHIQQLDIGPNYRWGTFENTGNGGIHYFADNNRYSFNQSEDTGDKNMGAGEGNCGFAVLDGHTFKNLGFNETINSLKNFGFAQSVRLTAADNIKHLYKYQNVILSGSDYISIYNRVGDMTTRGRFTWFVNRKEEFPNIIPIRHSENVKVYQPNGAVDFLEAGKSRIYREVDDDDCMKSKGVAYEGNGDFQTIVSHRDIQTEKFENYTLVKTPERQDILFDSDALICDEKENCSFNGYRGVLQQYKNGERKLAGFDVLSIRLYDVKLTSKNNKTAVSIEYDNSQYKGEIIAFDIDTVIFEFNGNTVEVEVDKGKYSWNLVENNINISNQKEEYEYLENTEFSRNIHRHEFGFNGFDFRRKPMNLKYPFQTE